jgi:hypothetical protein
MKRAFILFYEELGSSLRQDHIKVHIIEKVLGHQEFIEANQLFQKKACLCRTFF